MKHRSSRSLYDAAGALLAVVLLVATLGPIVRAGGLDRDKECVDNVYRLISALESYTEDFDEKLPPMQSYSAFQRAVAPYAQDSPRNIFYCPATQLAGYSLNRSLSGKPLAAIDEDVDTMEVERDSRPHPDGKLTVGFVDGHVERGGIDQAEPKAECVDRVRGLTEGVFSYMQDYDEQLPVAFNDAHYQELIYPYVKSRSIFECPATKQAYEFNLSINGRSLVSFPLLTRWEVPVLRDTADHRDGKRTVSFMDGHIEQGGVVQPLRARPSDR
jgi:prepilin-type processing-associated H-X9-DG protein